MKRYRIAVDIGGTFVDSIAFDRETGAITVAKAPTTPARPYLGVMEAIRGLGAPLSDVDIFVHGTTLGLNAILERKGAVTGILTNEGFRDVFEVGRGDVPAREMYNFAYQKPAALVKRRHRVGVAGRLDASGGEVRPLDMEGVRNAAASLRGAGIESLAIAMLHSYKNPAHEAQAARLVREVFPGLPVSVSSEITREYREYERTATTVLDAYIRPIFERYIDELDGALRAAGFAGRFLIMRSSSGAMTATAAKDAPIFTVMSGPAGGIIGAAYLARMLEKPRLLTLDYGGTSLDASVIEDGLPLVMHQAKLEHFPVLIPIFDIRCIGAGGGSIAWVQEGLLQVGPQSAGAVPGPIAYGKGGTEPTTTDAALVLGYLDPAGFLGGKLRLDADAARAGLDAKVAQPLDIDVVAAAAGIFDVLVAKTVSAIREITVERGKDPRDFSLLAFGGAGPMIAPLLAREIDNFELIVPLAPAAFSASGMLMSDLVTDLAQTNIQPLKPGVERDIAAAFRTLEDEARSLLARQGVDPADQQLDRILECRYAGQEHALEVPVDGEISAERVREQFGRLHASYYGHAMPDMVQVVTLRIRAIGRVKKPALARRAPGGGSVASARRGEREAFCFARRRMTRFSVFDRALLETGARIQGPAIVDEGTTTTVLHSDQSLEVDPYGHLIIRRTDA
jgi:N-methylhydantoinase A